MKIINAFMQNLNVNTDLGMVSAAKTNQKESFDKFMNDAGAKVKAADKSNNSTSNRRDTTKKVDSSKSKEGNSGATSKTKGNKEDATKKAVKDMAKETGVPEEVVVEILGQLNLTVFDLANTENLNAFLQKAYNVESPLELLDVPAISDIMANIGDIVDKYAKSMGSQELNEEVLSGELNLDSVVSEVATTGNKRDVAEETVPVDEEPDDVKTVDTSEAVVNDATENALQMGMGQNQEQALNSGGDNNQNLNIGLLQAGGTRSATGAASEAKTLSATGKMNPEEIIEQLMDNIKTNVKEGISEIKIVLKPEQLGDVTLKVLSENGIITAKFIAENERVKEIIESNFSHLKDSLLQQGISVSELSVSVGQDNSSDTMRRFMSEQQKSAARVRQIISGISDDFAEVEESVAATQVDDVNIDFTA